MRRATAARPPERTLGLCASFFLFVELPVELLEAEKLANVPGLEIAAVAALALNCSSVFDPSAGGLMTITMPLLQCLACWQKSHNG